MDISSKAKPPISNCILDNNKQCCAWSSPLNRLTCSKAISHSTRSSSPNDNRLSFDSGEVDPIVEANSDAVSVSEKELTQDVSAEAVEPAEFGSEVKAKRKMTLKQRRIQKNLQFGEFDCFQKTEAVKRTFLMDRKSSLMQVCSTVQAVNPMLALSRELKDMCKGRKVVNVRGKWQKKTSGYCFSSQSTESKDCRLMKQSLSPNKLQLLNPGNVNSNSLVNNRDNREREEGTDQSFLAQSQKYKTEICKNFELKGRCKWGENCCFAHGKGELRKKTLFNYFYKTKICKHFHKNGYCPYASRCQYYHFKTFQKFQELLESFSNKLVLRIKENKKESLAGILDRNGKV